MLKCLNELTTLDILKKPQNLPLGIRKTILWVTIVILGFALLSWWIKNIQKRLTSFQGEEFIEELELPKLEMPKLEMPKEEIEKKIKELEEHGR